MKLKWISDAEKEFKSIAEKKETWEKASQSLYKASELAGRMDTLDERIKGLETPFTCAERAFELFIWIERQQENSLRETLEAM